MQPRSLAARAAPRGNQLPSPEAQFPYLMRRENEGNAVTLVENSGQLGWWVTGKDTRMVLW